MQYAGDATISVTMVQATGTQDVVIPLLVARASISSRPPRAWRR